MRQCKGCAAALVKRSQLVYCSLGCQQATQRKALTERWLHTGEARVRGHQGHYLRDYLTDAQSHRCAICGIRSEWRGRPLAFILDHIDGDPTHNRRENLRLICPNCDSQLPTYKSRNRGNGRHSRRGRYANGQSY
ncbi:HNH endonuclease [Nocardia vinacea]|uniref:HNH endonuclease n=1 Tax=Nocardia vinacea TaxID=96468 RepID=UPI002E12D182|nr:HNH endonuclease [Nocardia vinacea]